MLEKGMCLTQNDTVILEIENVLGSTLNFATDSVVAKWDVSGPANSNGTITLNSGTLAVGATVTMMATTVDLSIPGVYTFNAYLEPSSYNLSVLNDTLEQSTFTVYPVWEVTPVSDTLYVVTDTAELEVKSPFLSGGDFFISEVCQYKYSVGAPTGGWPSYLIADDYIEITGVPGSDLAGITLEQWSTSAIMSTFTFLPGTLIGPNGTAIIAVGQMGSSTPSPTNFYYHGNGAYTGSFGSSGSNGRILKDANGVIMDAVGYGSSYTFPTISGVTSAEWTSTLAASTTTSGIRLQGADVNNSSTWVQSSTSPQDPNTVNSMVQVPSAGSTAGFSWSQVINGALVQVDTLPAIKVGATSPGIFYYVASFTNACGTFTDTVTIYSFIAGCPAPTNFAATAGCKDVTLTWISDAGTTDSYIEYGATGYTFGSGTPVVSASSPQVISGLTPNTGYDFYLVDSCAGGFTVPIMLSETTTSNPTVATFTWMQSATTMSNADVDFDASATVNGTTYTWDFGDASPAGTGVSPTHQYMSNGVYYATVTVDGPCDTDIYGDTVLDAGISIEESLLNTSLNVFPNPSNGNFRVEFQVEGLKNVTLRVSTLLGQEIYMSQPGNVSGEYREEIDLSNEASGVYVLQIITDENVVSRRITIRK